MFHVLLAGKTRIRERSYSLTTDNFLDFYTNKTKQHLHTQTYCQLLGLKAAKKHIQLVFFAVLWKAVNLLHM